MSIALDEIPGVMFITPPDELPSDEPVVSITPDELPQDEPDVDSIQDKDEEESDPECQKFLVSMIHSYFLVLFVLFLCTSYLSP